MSEIPEDIRLLSELVARRHEERKFAIGGQTTEAIAADIASALMAERERCASYHDDLAAEHAEVSRNDEWHRKCALMHRRAARFIRSPADAA